MFDGSEEKGSGTGMFAFFCSSIFLSLKDAQNQGQLIIPKVRTTNFKH